MTINTTPLKISAADLQPGVKPPPAGPDYQTPPELDRDL